MSLATSGCALWREADEAAPALPPARLSADSVVLEIAFVKLPDAAATSDPGDGPIDAADADWWAFVDEQPLSRDSRARLEANGIRCGVLGEQLPQALRNALPGQQKPGDMDPNATLEQQITQGSGLQRLPCRPGRRAEIQLGQAGERRVLLWHEGDQACGETFENAQCLLSVSTWPQPDGRAKLTLTPEIKHGQLRNRYVGQEGRFLIEAGQEQKVFHSLGIESLLAPGETLALAPTAELKGLGAHFFADPISGERRAVLIRLALTQNDGVFSPEETQSPLVTPLD